MKVEAGNAYAFKLTSGQEVVANLIELDNEYYHLQSPLTIGQGQRGGMEFLPIMMTGQHLSNCALQKSAVAMVLPVREDTLEVYVKSIDPDSVEILTQTKQIITG